MRLRWLLAIAVCLFCATTQYARSNDKQAMGAIRQYFADYKPAKLRLKGCGLERKRNNIIIGKKKITIYTSKNFGSQLFTPEMVDSIYEGIREVLPDGYKKHKLQIIANRHDVEHLIPNIYRKKKNVDDDVEYYSNMRAFDAVRRSDVCLLVVDSAEGLTEQDVKIEIRVRVNSKVPGDL